MGIFRWLVGGLIGGLVGGAIWVAVGVATQHEVGWIAWGIGFLVGLGVRYGAYLGDEEESGLHGVVAAILAIGSILAAKFVMFSILVGGASSPSISLYELDDEAMTSIIADRLVRQKMEAGETVKWKRGMTFEEASEKEDYPLDLWREAASKWKSLDTEQQVEMKQDFIQLATQFAGQFRPSFGEFFGGWDILWFGLAAFTAFRVGIGSYGSDE